MLNIKLLIFPLDLDAADPVIRIANALGLEVIGASSAMDSPGNLSVSQFIHLPFVTAPAFDHVLLETIHQHGITTIFAPHQVVWRHLDTLLRTAPDTYRFDLCKPDPFTATWQLFHRHEEWAAITQLSTFPGWLGETTVRPPLSRACYAALHRQFLSTPGDSDEGKLHALCDIMRILPPGNLLEVGCLYGRSALALGYLSSRHRIGSIICVDPWNTAELTDQGTQQASLDVERGHVNFEQIFRIFLSTAATLDNIGYIRKTSVAAQPVYEAARKNGRLDSPELGSITLTPHLSLLHIDGNHRYDHVQKDIETWSPYLISGGWLLLDDYVWAFGDGPKRAGDELLNSPLYDKAFVSGDTLFLRRSST